VKAYLVRANKVTEESTNDEILAAFRLLGKLQVRALVVKEENGVQRALAIQSIADPVPPEGQTEPAPVAVNPIVHSVVKSIINQIRTTINSLKDMGVAANVVDQLAATVVDNIAATIIDVVEAAADDIIQIPEGQSIESVLKAQED
jgi:signal-transduction protein with cAMP-binding, CBS, and nucleotidyltransferase domain